MYMDVVYKTLLQSREIKKKLNSRPNHERKFCTREISSFAELLASGDGCMGGVFSS